MRSKENAQTVITVINELLKLKPKIYSIRLASVWAAVCKHSPNVAQVVLAKELGYGPDRVSMLLEELGDRRDGLGLIRSEQDPDNFTKNIINLTVKGERLAIKSGLKPQVSDVEMMVREQLMHDLNLLPAGLSKTTPDTSPEVPDEQETNKLKRPIKPNKHNKPRGAK